MKYNKKLKTLIEKQIIYIRIQRKLKKNQSKKDKKLKK